MQYDLSTGQVVKAFGPVGIGSVRSSIRVNSMWFFGGRRSFKFVVIDSKSRQALGKPVESAIGTIYSLAVFKIHEKHDHLKVLLLNVGEFANYSEKQTDVFDITALVTRRPNLLNKQI